MKKSLSFLLVLIMLLGLGLVSCNTDGVSIDMGDVNETESETVATPQPETLPSVSEEIYAAYVLKYTSNGDGTCRVTDVKIKSSYHEEFELIIPEKSPDGDTVVAIDWGQAFDHIRLSVPYYVSGDELFDRIKGKAGDDEDIQFQTLKVCAFYSFQDPSSATNEMFKNEMLKTHPITSYMPIYVIDPTVSVSEFVTIRKILDEFQEYNVEFNEYNKIFAELSAKGLSKEEIEAFYDYLPEYGNYSTYVSTVVFPSTLKSIGEGCFDDFYCSESVVIPEELDMEILRKIVNGINKNWVESGRKPKLWLEWTELPADWDITWDYNLYSDTCPETEDEQKARWRYGDDGKPVSWYIYLNPDENK